MPPGPTLLWVLEQFQVSGRTFVDPSNLPDSDGHWKVRQHGTFSIPHEALGILPTDHRCHHEAWLHLDFVEWRSEQSHLERHGRRILLKETLCGRTTTANRRHTSARLRATFRCRRDLTKGPDDASFLIRWSHVFHSTLVVDHPQCMRDHLNTACHTPKKRASKKHTFRSRQCPPRSFH